MIRLRDTDDLVNESVCASRGTPRDAEVLLELVEAAYAEQGVPDDQQRPALADELDARAIEQFWPS
jgi:hypothetical protein